MKIQCPVCRGKGVLYSFPGNQVQNELEHSDNPGPLCWKCAGAKYITSIGSDEKTD